jgi:hypothetical protein
MSAPIFFSIYYVSKKKNNLKEKPQKSKNPIKSFITKFSNIFLKKTQKNNNKQPEKQNDNIQKLNSNDNTQELISFNNLTNNESNKNANQKKNKKKLIIFILTLIFVFIILGIRNSNSRSNSNNIISNEIKTNKTSNGQNSSINKSENTQPQQNNIQTVNTNNIKVSSNNNNIFFQKRCAMLHQKHSFKIGFNKNIYIDDNIYHFGDSIMLSDLTGNDKKVIIDNYEYNTPDTINIILKTYDNKICKIPVNTFSNFNYQIYFQTIKLTNKSTGQSLFFSPNKKVFFDTIFIKTIEDKKAIFNTPKGQFELNKNQ